MGKVILTDRPVYSWRTFEGATSYYDWRVLRQAKLCTVGEYLAHLAGELAYLDATPGRLVHALEEASFDAWIKLYRPDEISAILDKRVPEGLRRRMIPFVPEGAHWPG